MNKIEKQEWRNELQQNAPFLASLPRKNHFAAPEGYFEEARVDLVTKSIPSDNPFNVPDGYFERSKSAILSNIVTKENSKPGAKIISVKRLLITASAAAAIIIAIVVGSNYSDQYDSSSILADISADEADAYLQSRLYSLDENILYEEFSDEDLESLNIELGSTEIPEESIEEYLYYNIDQEILEEETL